MSNANQISAGQAFVKIAQNDSALEKGLKQQQGKLKNWSDSVNQIGKKMSLFSGVGAAAGFVALDYFKDFDDEMRKVQARTQATEKDFKALTEQARQIGATTSFTAKDAASGMSVLSTMGFSTGEIQQSIEQFMNLERAAGMGDLASTITMAASTMRAFGLDASESGRVVDVLAQTALSSAQDINDLAESMKNAGTGAELTNTSIEEISASLGVLANVGIRGSIQGTAVSRMFVRLTRPLEQSKLKQLGVDAVDSQGNLRPLGDILRDISKVIAPWGNAKQTSFLSEIFGEWGYKSAGQIIQNIDQYDEFLKKLQNSKGVAEEVQKGMDAGIGGLLRQFMSGFEELKLASGKAIAEVASGFIDFVRVGFLGVAAIIKNNQKLINTIFKIAVQVTAAGAVFMAFGAVLKTVQVATTVLSVALKVSAGQYSVLFAIIKAITAATVLFRQATYAAGIAHVVQAQKAQAAWTIANVPLITAHATLIAVSLAVQGLTYAILKQTGALSALAEAFSSSFAGIGKIVSTTFKTIKTGLEAGLLSETWDVIVKAMAVTWKMFTLAIRKSIEQMKLYFKSSWIVIKNSVLNVVNSMIYGIQIGFYQIANPVRKIWNKIIDGIVGSFYRAIADIEKAVVKVKSYLDSSIDVVFETKAIDNRTNSAVNAAKAESEAEAKANEQRLEQLKKERDEYQKNRDALLQDEIKQVYLERNNALASSEEALKKAKDEWQKAVDELNKKQAEKKQFETIAPAINKKMSQAIGESVVATGAAGSAGAGKALGGFNSKLVSSQLYNTAIERTANASEKSVILQEKTNKKLDELKEIELDSGEILQA